MLTSLAVVMGSSMTSRAQEAPPDVPSLPQDVPPAMPSAPAMPSMPGMPATPAAPATVTIARAEEPHGESDFDVDQRRWALGYAGVSVVPTGTGTLTVPAVGLRYWTSPGVGVDAALGVSWTGGSTSSGGTSVDKNASFGIIAQGGLPLVLATHRHVAFQVIPYLTVAYGLASSGSGTAKIDFDGLRLDVGVRAGFELFFGFIGIPQLALSATLGAQFEYLRLSQSPTGATSSTDTTFSISTTVQNNPWDIFVGNVAARYYF